MFAFDRSAVAVLLPLALLLAVVLFSNRETGAGAPHPEQVAARQDDGGNGDREPANLAPPRDQALAANLPSR